MTTTTGLRQTRAEKEIFGLCSEQEMDMELLERAINAQLENFILKQKKQQQAAVAAETNQVHTTAADPAPTVEKRSHKNAPKSLEAVELAMDKARDCAETGECSLEEIEELRQSINWAQVQQEIFGMADIEEQLDLEMLQNALGNQLELMETEMPVEKRA